MRAWTYLSLGANRFERMDWYAAIWHFTQAVHLRPRWSRGYAARGDARLRTGDFERAIEDYATAMLLSPKWSYAHYGRGLGRLNRRELQGAIEDFTHALELKSPSHMRILMPDGLKYGIRPRALYLTNRGMARLLASDDVNALADYDEAIKLAPRFADACLGRATVRIALEEYDLALADCAKAIRLHHKCLPAHLTRSVLYARRGDYDQAVAECWFVLSHDPKNVLAMNNLAWFFATCPYADYRDGQQALSLAENACKLAGPSVPSMLLNTLAAVFAENGDFAEAVRRQREAIERGDPGFDLERAQAQLALYERGEPFREEPGHKINVIRWQR